MAPRKLSSLLTLIATLGAAGQAAAEAEPQTPTARAAPRTDSLEQLVRGAYIEGRVGVGYMVKNKTLEDDPAYPLLTGKSEALGVGSSVLIALGYDITPMVALQAIGGAAMVSGSRQDRVRDLAMLLGGAGLRLGFQLDERLFAVASPSVVFMQADDGVQTPAASGIALHAALGLEYYVHVRHFSVGVDVSGLLPVSPLRAFVSVAPRIKYTF